MKLLIMCMNYCSYCKLLANTNEVNSYLAGQETGRKFQQEQREQQEVAAFDRNHLNAN